MEESFLLNHLQTEIEPYILSCLYPLQKLVCWHVGAVALDRLACSMLTYTLIILYCVFLYIRDSQWSKTENEDSVDETLQQGQGPNNNAPNVTTGGDANNG